MACLCIRPLTFPFRSGKSGRDHRVNQTKSMSHLYEKDHRFTRCPFNFLHFSFRMLSFMIMRRDIAIIAVTITKAFPSLCIVSGSLRK